MKSRGRLTKEIRELSLKASDGTLSDAERERLILLIVTDAEARDNQKALGSAREGLRAPVRRQREHPVEEIDLLRRHRRAQIRKECARNTRD